MRYIASGILALTLAMLVSMPLFVLYKWLWNFSLYSGEEWDMLISAIEQNKIADYTFFIPMIISPAVWFGVNKQVQKRLLPADESVPSNASSKANYKTNNNGANLENSAARPQFILKGREDNSTENPYGNMYGKNASPSGEIPVAPKVNSNLQHQENESVAPAAIKSVQDFLDKNLPSKTAVTNEKMQAPPPPVAAPKQIQDDAEIKQELLSITENAGYKIFEGVRIEDVAFDYIAVSHKQIMLCLIENSDTDFVANEKSLGDEAPSWFSPKYKKISPIYQLSQAIKQIRELVDEVLPQNHGVKITNRLILTKSNIVNFDELGTDLVESGVMISRYYQGRPNEIPKYEEILVDQESNPASESFAEFIKTMIEYFDTPGVEEDEAETEV